VAEGCSFPEPVHLLFVDGDGSNCAPQPRLHIDLGRDARATLAQHYLGSPASANWTNAVTRVNLDAGAQLTLRRIQDHGPQHIHTELFEAVLAERAGLHLTYVDFGARLVRNDIQIELNQRGATCDVAGLFSALDGQHVDNHVRIDHRASDTRSIEAFRSIIGDQGRGVFNGKVIVHKGTHGIDARQASDNLLLSDRGEIDTKPELEIYTDDVKCSHGATVGELDEDQLFYLKARGIADSAARGLLTLAFANQILERIPLENLKHRLTRKLGLDLPEEPERISLP
jgi:Fe-S cluster assembly protein SufD